ncbi:16S rRNA (cytidine(1402)-2'-O)-methyltransferase [bacterium]|nr:16S rRNA (cytidine(1402)-2'-O)-methyltransferase [bacterium]
MLYIISTPIGNLEDISLRAIRILKEVELIASEDTRHTQRLLAHYSINTPLTSYHDHNKEKKTPELIEKLKQGMNIALVSDAGTPCISDPGFYIVREIKKEGLPITAIPGPCAAIDALVLSNLPVDKFMFLGYLSPKPGKRKKQIEAVNFFSSSVIIYESPYKILKTVQSINEVYGNIEITIARELTKIYEEVVTHSAEEWIRILSEKQPKGELVVIFVPKGL